MQTSENNKRDLNKGLAEEKTQKYLKFRNNDYPYLKTNKDIKAALLPVPENSMVQRHIRGLNKISEFS